jgi:hypothetical protein
MVLEPTVVFLLLPSIKAGEYALLSCLVALIIPANPAPATCNPVVLPEIPFEVPEPTRTFSELSIVIAVASELSEIPVLNKPLDIFVSAILSF